MTGVTVQSTASTAVDTITQESAANIPSASKREYSRLCVAE